MKGERAKNLMKKKREEEIRRKYTHKKDIKNI